jgi:hypothetical protein
MLLSICKNQQEQKLDSDYTNAIILILEKIYIGIEILKSEIFRFQFSLL